MDALKGEYILLSERIVDEKNGTISAFCDELGLATCGSSHSEASRRLRKAIQLTLNTATTQGEILDLLQDRGIRLYPMATPQAPSHISSYIGTSFSVGEAVSHRPYLIAAGV